MTNSPRLMAWTEHIEEFRRRLLVAIVALIVTSLASTAFVPQLVEWLTRPVGGMQALQSIEVTENASIFFRVAFASGLALSLPVWIYELLAFLFPAMERHEKRWILIGLPFATLLFVGGVAFGYFVMLPTALPVLQSGFLDIKNAIRPENYFRFVTSLLLWLGVSFETPLLIFILARLRLVTAGQLARYWRYAVIAIALIAGIVTPTTDPISMIVMMLPLLVLYWLSVFLAWLAVPRRKKVA
ncbi:MAG: twin-arginine translocase subunit TatC [Longilinea sp.]|nr:twin-arginine translocase subunit TatC [Longilinea sp.]